MSDILKNIFRFVIFILVQVFVLFQIKPLHHFIVPYLYYIYILWLPFNTSRRSLTGLGFLLGLTLDYFTKSPGLHAAACTLIAFLRPNLISLLMAREGAEQNYNDPSANSMGWVPYITYVVVLTLVHHSYLVLLEWLDFGYFLYFLGKVLGTTAISFMLVVIAELISYRKQKFKTNIV
jgi:rod shape-determining protein MreD